MTLYKQHELCFFLSLLHIHGKAVASCQSKVEWATGNETMRGLQLGEVIARASNSAPSLTDFFYPGRWLFPFQNPSSGLTLVFTRGSPREAPSSFLGGSPSSRHPIYKSQLKSDWAEATKARFLDGLFSPANKHHSSLKATKGWL